jgi:hypothetical protein
MICKFDPQAACMHPLCKISRGGGWCSSPKAPVYSTPMMVSKAYLLIIDMCVLDFQSRQRRPQVKV